MREYRFYLVSTPIGNLGDISSRAVETLRAVDVILAEDTRTARVLLARYGIRTPVRAYHDFTEAAAAPGIVRKLKDGATMALIAEAGTPLVSDPGFHLVRRLIEEDIATTAVPGPCAAVAALVLSGLPPDRFTFYGYVPRKKGEREALILEAAASRYTSIFYESPRRLAATLGDVARLAGERELAVARELTKVFEEVARGTARELLERFGRSPVKGEITLLMRGLGRRRASRRGAAEGAEKPPRR